MKKVQYSIYKKDTGDAGGKAKNDVYDILLRNGFSPSYIPSDRRIIRIIQQLLSIKNIKHCDCLVVQYPAIRKELMSIMMKTCSKVKKRIVIVHDIRAIQGLDGNIVNEIAILNFFNYAIVHNQKMEQFLKDNGYIGNTICLDLFDYIHDINRSVVQNEYSNTITIAGNLDKSGYLSSLGKIDTKRFYLYGKNSIHDFTGINNVQYRGLLPSEEIVYLLEGDYGLVWDGDSIDSCSGRFGNYLLYNNPHKLSLYVAAEKPVITWSKAAIAPFVKRNNIGIVVDSLLDLNNIDLLKNYNVFKSNVITIRKQIGCGEYLDRAIKKIVKGA